MAKTKKTPSKTDPDETTAPVAARPPVADELPSSRQLLRSSGIAAAVALVVLVVAVLPAEYGIDPTGIGRVLGLTQMGEMKVQLAKEAAGHGAAPTATPSPANPATTAAASAPAANSATSSAAEVQTAEATASAASAATSDVTKVTLEPNQSTEVKLSMSEGAKATFDWSVEGGEVNYDLHADRPGGAYHGYKKGKGAKADKGELVAAFDGWHGWFWRNRSEKAVTITLKTTGDYREVKEMK